LHPHSWLNPYVWCSHIPVQLGNGEAAATKAQFQYKVHLDSAASQSRPWRKHRLLGQHRELLRWETLDVSML
jgi:hypothetical protein